MTAHTVKQVKGQQRDTKGHRDRGGKRERATETEVAFQSSV